MPGEPGDSATKEIAAQQRAQRRSARALCVIWIWRSVTCIVTTAVLVAGRSAIASTRPTGMPSTRTGSPTRSWFGLSELGAHDAPI